MKNKIYGILKDKTILSENIIEEIVAEGFENLKNGNAKILKKRLVLKTSVKKLPEDLQKAAFYL